MPIKTILSIQSHVAYGHVGNAAAVFPLQRMGYEVVPVHTVQFSNHTGYGTWAGQVFEAAHIDDILKGLEAHGVLARIDALLTGYMGSPAIAALIALWRQRLPRTALWICDPVMGDAGCGLFVHAGLPDFFRAQASHLSDIMTPNQFEIEQLTGINVMTLDDARAACRILHDKGVRIVLVTSLRHNDTAPGTIEMLVSEAQGAGARAVTPLLSFSPPPNGAGDATAAIFTGHILAGAGVVEALQRTASAIYSLMEATLESGGRELALIAAQDRMQRLHPSVRLLS
ncbi:MAG: pyridoxal kinase PdxY [Micavibrio aeruginosavorus]|uniref:pyridoxal kinase n=1 Tax=Micavibrio aeruginosavorus TaxID=349221 RepID=A0A7T5UIH2_9BACT|nr:MAG: pyridoxal kinase PdxY [Micavibrio aeruginosavorus]